MKPAFSSLLALVALAPCLTAATISVNFTDNASAASTMATTDVAGAAALAGGRVANWNNYTVAGASKAATALGVDSEGTPVSTTVAYTTDLGNWRLDHAVTDGDDRMWKGYLDVAAAGTITVAGVPYANYSVIIYFDGANGTNWKTASYTIGGATLGGEDSEKTDWKKAGGQNSSGIYQMPIAGGTGNVPFTGTNVGNNSEGNYIVFTGLSGPSFTISAAGTGGGGGGNRAPINGFQIVQVPEPASGLLAALGLLAVLRRRRA